MASKHLTLSQLCDELSISLATGRNWLRLGKISPSSYDHKTPLFDSVYVSSLKKDIESGKNTSLKSRRNKKYKSGFDLYNSYVSKSSPNISSVLSALTYIKEKELTVDEALLRTLLSECALQLINDKTQVAFLVDDLLDGKKLNAKFRKAHQELFSISYTYIPTEDTLGLLYISLSNLTKRKANGSYFTPTEVVGKLCDNLFSKESYEGKEILDPCCGTGNFILQLPDGIKSQQVYGNDIDEISVNLARINYALKYDVYDRDTICSHITQSDFLNMSDKRKFDYIIGNPPWGSERPYDDFVEKGIKSLKKNGHLSFVLPESILSVKAHKSIREILLGCCSFEYVEYLGEVFHGVQCPSIILNAKYTMRPFSSKGLVVNDAERKFTIQTVRDINPTSLSFRITDDEYEVIRKMESIENKTTLKGHAVFGLGIVTGDNKSFISDVKTKGNEPVLKGTDISKFKYEVSNNFMHFEPDKFQQVAKTEVYRAKEKLLYRFISKELVFAYDDTGILSLNSCNILIPQIPGLSMKYVMAVLNSSAAQFYYSKMFGSVKVLRSHLEQIPIPVADAKNQRAIVKLVDEVVRTGNSATILKLDRKIAELYGLSLQNL